MSIEIIGLIGSNKKPKGFESGFLKLKDRYVIKSLGGLDGSERCFYHFGGISNTRNIYSEENYNGIKYIQTSGKPFLVGEYTPFRQIPNYTKIGWKSYNYKDGIFNNENVSLGRWNLFKKQNKIEIKDWHHCGDNILIMGQLEYDSALNSMYSEGYLSFDDWVLNTILSIRKYSDRPILYRPHPKSSNLVNLTKEFSKFKNVSISKNVSWSDYKKLRSGGSGLEVDLNTAYCVISYSSNSTVEAVCKGIPIFLKDSGSAAFELTQDKIENIEKIDYSKNIDEWGKKIVYSIWNQEEIASGMCWAHLKPTFFKI